MPQPATPALSLAAFGCAPSVCEVIDSLPLVSRPLVRGRAHAYRLLLPEEGTPSGLHAHADRLYLLLDPADAERLQLKHGANVMRHNPTTWYASWSAQQLEDPALQTVATEAAVLALSRAARRSLSPDGGVAGTRRRLPETCSVCWQLISPSGACQCDDD